MSLARGGSFAKTAGFAVALTGTKTGGVVHCDQPRPIDLAARGGRRIETVPGSVMEEVLARVAPIFE